jgi:hypothetical protein
MNTVARRKKGRSGDTVRTFRRRRNRLRASVYLAFLIFPMAVLTQVVSGEWHRILIGSMLLLAITPIILASRYRCPACGAVPRGRKGAVKLDPSPNCHGCGARLL